MAGSKEGLFDSSGPEGSVSFTPLTPTLHVEAGPTLGPHETNLLIIRKGRRGKCW